jgi:hypothetical protein
MRRSLLPLLLLLAGCARAPRPVPGPPPAPPTPAAPPPPSLVWNREAGLALLGERPGSVPFLATRLEVLEVRPDSFRVRCAGCAGGPSGLVARTAVAWEPLSPSAARRGDLADFIVALRSAAVRQDYEAMRVVMARNFVHAIVGPDGPLQAIGAWRGARAADLARLPPILDRGTVLVPGTPVWAAPPEFANVRGYADLRAGFTRGEAGWEWVFLVRNEL